MGRIMMNGIQYGTGGRPTAEGVTYDNAESGMTATNVQSALDELSTGLTQLIRTESFTATTSSGGNVYHDFDGDVFVLGANCNKSDTFIVPFVSINSGTPYLSRWWFNARNAGTSGSAVTGTSMTITVAYVVLN